MRYRLAPENRFPAPLDDCLEALRRLVAEAAQLGVDPCRVAVGGTSAGANLAAAATLASREAARPRLRFQVLVYPALLYGSDTESMRRDFPSFDGRDVEWCWSHYLARAEDGRECPGFALLADLRGLPPALIVTAEHDPLRDEGELAEKLRQSGVDVDVVRIAGAAHGFFSGTEKRTTSARGSSPRRSAARSKAPRMIDTGLLPGRALPGIGIVGCGQIVEDAHPPRTPGTAARSSASTTFGRRQRAASARRLLARRAAGRPANRDRRHRDHPDVRVGLIRRALDGSTCLPRSRSPRISPPRAPSSRRPTRGLTLAVNQNARWAPPWRIATCRPAGRDR